MATITNTETYQLRLREDAAIDDARTSRLEWQRAVDMNLHAVQDDIDPNQLIIWRPVIHLGGSGYTSASDRQAFDVQLTTTTSCTCSRFRLRDRCEHLAFVRKLESSKITPGPDLAIHAKEVAS